MPQNNDLTAKELSAELAAAIDANKEFIDEIDRRILAADHKYLKAILEEKKGYLRLAKRALQKKKDDK